MAFPTKAITQILIQLGPHVPDTVEKLRKLIDTLRKPGANTQKQVDDLKQAIELQLGVNNELGEQFKLVKGALENVQISLKISMTIAAGAALIAVIALIFSLTH